MLDLKPVTGLGFAVIFKKWQLFEHGSGFWNKSQWRWISGQSAGEVVGAA